VPTPVGTANGKNSVAFDRIKKVSNRADAKVRVLPNQITPVVAGVIYFFNLLSFPFLVKRKHKNHAINNFFALCMVNNMIAFARNK
jgi:hypothetical protein